MMKRLLTAMFALAVITSTINAQIVSKDSISILKSQKETALLAAKLNEQKLKLADMENSLDSKSAAEQQARKKAQESADENSKIASDLSGQAESKKLARKAKKAAKSAKKDAKKLRKASGDLDELKSGIESLKKKIASDEAKLQSMQVQSGN